MNKQKAQIGFSSQRIRYQWLVKVSNLLLAGMTSDQIKSELSDYLMNWLPKSRSKERSSRDKAATILFRTWISPDNYLCYLRDDGLKLLESSSAEEKRAVHWGMIMATYPFWGDVADSVGRLLRLQNSIETSQIRRRIKELYGDREVVSRATRNVISSFVDWGVLYITSIKGAYISGKQYPIKDAKVIAWLVEASLHARMNGSAAIKDLLNSPSIFPFRLAHISAEQVVSLSPRLDILRHGLDDNLVMLQK
jgi:hypothetical protein